MLDAGLLGADGAAVTHWLVLPTSGSITTYESPIAAPDCGTFLK